MKATEGDRACARAALYGLAATALRHPDAHRIEALTSDESWSALDAAVGAIGDAALFKAFAELREKASALDADDLRRDFARIFGHAVRGACPLYELEYGAGDIVQKAPELADIQGFHAAFGLEIDPSERERVDHLALECEFMNVLATREAVAIEAGDAEGRAVIAQSQKIFFADHLGRWAPACAQRIREADLGGFFGATAGVLLAHLDAESRALDEPIGPLTLQLRPVSETADATIQCGAEESCPGAEGGSLLGGPASARN
jgi:DMSO reductase family type II enzyme chaperone